MAGPFKPDGCFYMDDEGAVFSISVFISLNGLPDDPRIRTMIIEEIQEMFPDVRILEEIN
jgi:hypothetical protein